jgi:hypothetical protein
MSHPDALRAASSEERIVIVHVKMSANIILRIGNMIF